MDNTVNFFRENIYKDGEYSYPAAYGFVPNIRAYLHPDSENKNLPCMIVVPGGGYCMVVNLEGEPVALDFYERGYNVFVLTYTTDITTAFPLKFQPLNDISRAVRYIRKNSGRFGINESKVTICGFSAGGHVCATLGTHYNDVIDSDEELNKISNRPDSMILGYPVITSGEYTHEYSMISLLGRNPSEEDLLYFSLEKNVTPDTPPAFVWQTVEDNLVPVENSMMFAESLRANKVPYAYYAFPHGIHGLSASNNLVKTGQFGEPYTMEQMFAAVDAVKTGKSVGVSDERINELLEQFKEPDESDKKNADSSEESAHNGPQFYDDVSLWINLAEIWLKGLNP